MTVDLQFTGDREIDAILRGLPTVFQHRILQAAHADAAKVFVEKEKQLAPIGFTRKLVGSIGVTKPTLRKAGEIGEVIVGPRRGRFGGSHGHFIEFGTRPRTFNGAYRGIVRARPYAKPTFESTNRQVLGKIQLSLANKTLAFMNRFIKKHG